VRDVAGYVSERGVLRVEFLIHIGLAVRLQRSLAYGRGGFSDAGQSIREFTRGSIRGRPLCESSCLSFRIGLAHLVKPCFAWPVDDRMAIRGNIFGQTFASVTYQKW
jgi:hypothetical protein